MALVAGAGLVAGAVNAVAGGGTLVSFPALLAVGLAPLPATITSAVGLLSGYVGGSVAYRRELAGQGARARALIAVSVLGGIVGAVLLLRTPESSFTAVVPYLVLLSCALLAAQPALTRAVARARGGHQGPASGVTWPARAGIGIGAIYGSYFGAGLGVLLLAVMGALIHDDLQRLNALKGVLSLVINVTGVVIFLASGEVVWLVAAILAVSAYLGATFGVLVARRLPAPVIRAAVVVLGVVVGVTLLVRG